MLLNIFLGLIAFILWVIIGFPLSFIILSKLKNQPVYDNNTDYQPSVDIVVAAYNEAHNLPTKIESTQAQNYPGDKWRLIIASDGSSDNTKEVVASYKDDRIIFLDLERQGKISVLNEAMNHLKNDIVIYSDADISWHPDLIAEIIKPLSNDKIATVGGKIVVKTATKSVGLGDKVYRLYENMLRSAENKLLATVSADGGIFAIRKKYVCGIPAGVSDDFYISTHPACFGKSLYFQDSAIVYDEALVKPKKQFTRRVRLTVQGLTSVWRRRELLHPRKAWYAYSLFNHKVLRRLIPPAILLLLPINLLLMFSYKLLLITALIQLGVYSIALIGFLDKNKNLPNVCYLLTNLVVNFIAGSWAIIKFLKGDRIQFWDPSTNRS